MSSYISLNDCIHYTLSTGFNDQLALSCGGDRGWRVLPYHNPSSSCFSLLLAKGKAAVAPLPAGHATLDHIIREIHISTNAQERNGLIMAVNSRFRSAYPGFETRMNQEWTLYQELIKSYKMGDPLPLQNKSLLCELAYVQAARSKDLSKNIACFRIDDEKSRAKIAAQAIASGFGADVVEHLEKYNIKMESLRAAIAVNSKLERGALEVCENMKKFLNSLTTTDKEFITSILLVLREKFPFYGVYSSAIEAGYCKAFDLSEEQRAVLFGKTISKFLESSNCGYPFPKVEEYGLWEQDPNLCQENLYKIAVCTIDKQSWCIAPFGLKSEEHRFEIAKKILEMNPNELVRSFSDYNITNPEMIKFLVDRLIEMNVEQEGKLGVPDHIENMGFTKEDYLYRYALKVVERNILDLSAIQGKGWIKPENWVEFVGHCADRCGSKIVSEVQMVKFPEDRKVEIVRRAAASTAKAILSNWDVPVAVLCDRQEFRDHQLVVEMQNDPSKASWEHHAAFFKLIRAIRGESFPEFLVPEDENPAVRIEAYKWIATLAISHDSITNEQIAAEKPLFEQIAQFQDPDARAVLEKYLPLVFSQQAKWSALKKVPVALNQNFPLVVRMCLLEQETALAIKSLTDCYNRLKTPEEQLVYLIFLTLLEWIPGNEERVELIQKVLDHPHHLSIVMEIMERGLSFLVTKENMKGKDWVVDILEKHFNPQLKALGVENVEGCYANTVGRFRKKELLFIYWASLANDRDLHSSFPSILRSILLGNFKEERYDNAHLNAMKGRYPDVVAKWKEGMRLSKEGFEVCDTDDPNDLLLFGEEVRHPVLKITMGDTDGNRGLLGCLMNGFNRLVAVKDGKGTIVAGAFLRLYWDGAKPVLFQEAFHASGDDSRYEKLVNEMCQARARTLQVPLVSKKNTATPYSKSIEIRQEKVVVDFVEALTYIVHQGHSLHDTYEIKV